jgi:hypothetical protein
MKGCVILRQMFRQNLTKIKTNFSAAVEQTWLSSRSESLIHIDLTKVKN